MKGFIPYCKCLYDFIWLQQWKNSEKVKTDESVTASVDKEKKYESLGVRSLEQPRTIPSPRPHGKESSSMQKNIILRINYISRGSYFR